MCLEYAECVIMMHAADSGEAHAAYFMSPVKDAE